MFFSILKKSFDSVYLTEEAGVLKKKKNKFNKTSIYLKSKHNINKKRIFYIIQRSPGAGLFSNLLFVLNHLNICDRHSFIPIIDMENFPTIYNEKRKIFNSYNAWDYYFEPVSKYKLNKIYKFERAIISSSDYYKSFQQNSVEIKKIYKKYIKINKKILKEADVYIKKNIKNKKVLAIHYRGTSYKTSAGHPYPPTFNQMKFIIDYLFKKDKYDKFYLCTEDKKMFENLKKIYEEKMIYKDCFRSYKDDAFKIYPRHNHRYLLGKEIMVESIIMSKCQSFLSSETNISNFIHIIKKKNKPKFYKIENGYNSTNEYYAMWLWYIKRILPSFLGGFGKSVDISNPKFN